HCTAVPVPAALHRVRTQRGRGKRVNSNHHDSGAATPDHTHPTRSRPQRDVPEGPNAAQDPPPPQTPLRLPASVTIGRALAAMADRPDAPVRLTDIAAQAGVSQATVSRVLNGRPGVSPSTRQAVLMALDIIGVERPARSRSAGLVGLITPELDNPIFPAY